jgi:hypothetical protein
VLERIEDAGVCLAETRQCDRTDDRVVGTERDGNGDGVRSCITTRQHAGSRLQRHPLQADCRG